MLVRPIQFEDLDRLYSLSQSASFGLTSLPQDREYLEERIYESVRSFEKRTSKPGGESYLFVLEDDGGVVVGSAGIKAKVGGFEPFYSYRLRSIVHESSVLNLRKSVRVLQNTSDHNGPTEIGSLFVSPEFRKKGAGRFLSIMRFLFMAEHRERFEKTVIAEMRGVIDENGRSPFWDGLGHLFFEVEFPRADYLSIKNKRFIAELMPEYPIYVDLLPPAAREAIGQVHENTRGALHILEKEGFRRTDLVDIFDGGPLIRCPLKDIRAVWQSCRAPAEKILPAAEMRERMYYISKDGLADFRAGVGRVHEIPGGGVEVDEKTATLLGISPGDEIRYVPARPA